MKKWKNVTILQFLAFYGIIIVNDKHLKTADLNILEGYRVPKQVKSKQRVANHS